MDDEILGEVATAKLIKKQWVMKFNGSSIPTQEAQEKSSIMKEKRP